MTKTDHIKKNIFGLIFSIFTLLLLILGNTFLSWYLIGLGSVGVLIYCLNVKNKPGAGDEKTLFLWLLFLIIIGLSFFTTHSIPKTLDSLGFYSFSFLIFWLFVSIPKSAFSRKSFLQSIFSIVVVLLVTSLGISFFESNSLGLPGMNLLYPTYGHNHLAAVIILVLPLSWWFYFEKKLDNKYYLLLPLLLTLGLMLSFGRVAIFIGLLQLLYISHSSKIFKKGFRYLIYIFLFLLSIKAIFSLSSSDSLLSVCSNDSWLDGRLCKSITKEVRPFYWQQAISAIRDYPLLGYGAGNFLLVSTRYAQLPHATSSHAHNAFLQLFAELGLIGGGIFLVLMLRLLLQSGVVVKKEEKQLASSGLSFKKAALVGVISIYVDVLFDFDWNFLGIFFLTLVLLAMIMRGNKKRVISVFVFNLEKALVVIISGVLVALTFLFIVSEILIKSGNTKKAFELFPYFSAHQGIFMNEELLEDENMIDPWNSFSNSQLEQLLESNDYGELNSRLLSIYNLLDVAWEKYQYDVGYDKKSEFFEYSLALADFLMLQNRYDEASPHYVWVYKTEPWILLSHEIPLDKDFVDMEKMDVFLKSITVVDRANWLNHSEALIILYKKQLFYEIETGDLSSMNYYLNYFSENISLDYQEQLQLKARLQLLANILISSGDYKSAEMVLKILVRDINKTDYWGSSQLGNFYIHLHSKELSFLTKEELVAAARKAYIACDELFEGSHKLCASGVESLIDGSYDLQIYGKVSKILLKRGGLVEKK